MPAAGRSVLARHVAAAKRLLWELEEQAETALQSLGGGNGDDFLAAVSGRDQVLSQLDDVVEAFSHERDAARGGASENDPEAERLMAEIARAAAAVLESHENLVAQARRERDRLATVLHQVARSDAVANQYALASKSNRPLTLSVTG